MTTDPIVTTTLGQLRGAVDARGVAAFRVHQVAETVDRAHEIEATIAYDVRDFPLAPVPSQARDGGLSL